MNKRKYQWPIYETWIVTSKPSWSFNFILGYKEVVFTLEFLRQNAHCYAKKCYASGKQLTPVLFRKHGRVYILMARTKTKTCHKAEGRASTNPSLASLSRGVGGGGGGLFMTMTMTIYFQHVWRGVGVDEVGDHLHPKIKIKSEFPQVNHTGSVHISLVPRRSLLPRCPRKVWERAGERRRVSLGEVTVHDNVQDWTSQGLADSTWNIAVVIN